MVERSDFTEQLENIDNYHRERVIGIGHHTVIDQDHDLIDNFNYRSTIYRRKTVKKVGSSIK
jgi:hypothetical protein